MKPARAAVGALFACAACSASGSASNGGDAGPTPDGGSAATDGAGELIEAGHAEGGSFDASARVDGGSGGDGGVVVPGNGCPAALGVDAGFYSCMRQFYVSPGGSDANGGTSPSDAIATLGAATRLPLRGGDCVTVAAGTYDETVSIGASGSADTCTGYVVFRAASQGSAKIVSTDTYHAVLVTGNYIMMDGFNLQDTSTGDAFAAGSNTVTGGHVVITHHVAVVRSVAHDSGGAGLSAIHADYVRFEENTVYKNAATSPYGDSGIDLWEAQAVDAAPGFHIVVRNNASFQNGNWSIANPSDGEGIILDSFDYADATYGTLPYTQQSLVENNVVWGNGGRGIEAGGAGPTSYVTVRNNTVFDDNRQQLPWPGAELQSLGNQNALYNNVAVVGPDAKDGPSGNGLTVALQDACGTQGGVAVTTGSVWQGNIAFSVLSGSRLTNDSCSAPVSTTANQLGMNPALESPGMSATSADAFRITASSPAAHAGTPSSFPAFDFAYAVRSNPPSVGAFEP